MITKQRRTLSFSFASESRNVQILQRNAEWLFFDRIVDNVFLQGMTCLIASKPRVE